MSKHTTNNTVSDINNIDRQYINEYSVVVCSFKVIVNICIVSYHTKLKRLR